MEMYRTTKYGCEIEEVVIEKKTEKSVWVNGNRNSIHSDFYQFHESFGVAKNYLLDKAKRRIESSKYHLECAESFLKNVESQIAPKVK